MLAVVLWSRMYSSDRILIKNKSTDLDWMTGCVSLYVYISVECYGMCVPTNAMAMGPARPAILSLIPAVKLPSIPILLKYH